MLPHRLSSWAASLTFASITFCILVTTSIGYRDTIADISRRLLRTQSSASPATGAQFPKPSTVVSLPCPGPRGKLLNESLDDQLIPVKLDGGRALMTLKFVSNTDVDLEYPQTLGGSHEALGLPHTWLSAAARYGPYGYREDEAGYGRIVVDWDSTDWGQLQRRCMSLNADRFSRTTEIKASPKFALRTWKQRALRWGIAGRTRRSSSGRAGRTAIVIRSWETYEYTPEDLWYLRSIIAEAALSTGSRYAVYLLVDIKDKSHGIHHNASAYATILQSCVPPELQSIAVLFDGTLLESWYPGVPDHRCVPGV